MSNPVGVATQFPVFNLNDGTGILAGSDPHPTVGLLFAAPGGHRVVSGLDPLPVTTTAQITGPYSRLTVDAPDILDVLEQILMELRIANFHLGNVSGQIVNRQDLGI